MRTWKAYTGSTGASSLLPDRHNSKRAKGFGASINREEAPILPVYAFQVRISAMNPFSPSLGVQIDKHPLSQVKTHPPLYVTGRTYVGISASADHRNSLYYGRFRPRDVDRGGSSSPSGAWERGGAGGGSGRKIGR